MSVPELVRSVLEIPMSILRSLGVLSSEEDKEVERRERPGADDSATKAPQAGDDKPARREPVIFSPRPSANDKPKDDEVTPAAEAKDAAPAEPQTPAEAEDATKDAAAASDATAPEPAESATVSEPADATADAAEATTTPTATAPAAANDTGKAADDDASGASAENATAAAETAAAAKDAAKAGAAEVASATGSRPAGAEKAAEPAAAGDVPAEPLPGYAELSVASLRARMRGRSAEQIKELLAYEQATSARENVMKMYENRLAKLAVGGDA